LASAVLKYLPGVSHKLFIALARNCFVTASMLPTGSAVSVSGLLFFLQTFIAWASGAKSTKHKVQSMKVFFMSFLLSHKKPPRILAVGELTNHITE
jgi:hypothetical protein